MMKHIQKGHGERVKKALTAITETTCALVQRVIEMGADGIFFATQLSSLCQDEESLLQKNTPCPISLAVLSASSGWCNVLHAHGPDIMFPLLRKYPVQIFNWHAWESLPEIGESGPPTGKCLMAGLERMDITEGHKNEIEDKSTKPFARQEEEESSSPRAASSATPWTVKCSPSSEKQKKK